MQSPRRRPAVFGGGRGAKRQRASRKSCAEYNAGAGCRERTIRVVVVRQIVVMMDLDNLRHAATPPCRQLPGRQHLRLHALILLPELFQLLLLCLRTLHTHSGLRPCTAGSSDLARASEHGVRGCWARVTAGAAARVQRRSSCKRADHACIAKQRHDTCCVLRVFSHAGRCIA